MAETQNHRDLKRLALLWAQARGYTCAALEVSLPRCNFRADAAAYKPVWRQEQPGEESDEPPMGPTAVFECKQSRSDLLNDCALALAASTELRALHERRTTLERLLRVHHPSLCNGDSLFSEWTSYSLESLQHRGLQTVLRKIAIAQRKILTNNKFEKLVRYRCANVCYLVVENGICAEHELPLGWGLLVRCGETLCLERKPVWQETTAAARLALLQRIALCGTRALNAKLGISFDERIEARNAADF